MSEFLTERRSVTLDSGVRVKALVDVRNGREMVAARWPDDFGLAFQGGVELLDDSLALGDVVADARERYERQPGALWGAWEWIE